MGLAQVIERPRNWQAMSSGFVDLLSTVEDGHFFAPYQQAVTSAVSVSRLFWPFDVVVTGWGIYFSANGLTAASVNTITMEVNNVDQTPVLTILSTDAINTLLSVNAANILVPANTQLQIRWNSNSAGIATTRGFEFHYRAVNPV